MSVPERIILKTGGQIMKLAFNCDYLEGAHEKILKRLIDTEKKPWATAMTHIAPWRRKK